MCNDEIERHNSILKSNESLMKKYNDNKSLLLKIELDIEEAKNILQKHIKEKNEILKAIEGSKNIASNIIVNAKKDAVEIIENAKYESSRIITSATEEREKIINDANNVYINKKLELDERQHSLNKID